MKRVLVLSMGGLLVAGSVATASAQSLADVARQEQERRRAIKAPARVYTDADTQKAAPLTTAAGRPAKEEAAQPATGGGEVQSDPQDGSSAKPATSKAATPGPQGEAAWRAKVQEAQEGLARSRRFLEALEQQAMRAAVAAANATASGQQSSAGSGDQERTREMERLRAEVDRFSAALASIAEEARRAGVPPGWVR